MELDQEKQNQEAAERCRALAQRVVRELAPRSVQVLEDSGLLEKAFCKMNTAVVQSAPELLVVADPQWVTLPAVQAEKVLLVCAEYAGMADCAKQLAAQGFCRELAWKDRGKEQLTALFCRMAAPELPELENGYEQQLDVLRERTLLAERTAAQQAAQLERLRSDLSLSRSHEQELEKTLNSVVNSTFWKASWPLRYLVSKCRQLWRTFPLFVFFATLRQVGFAGVMAQAKAKKEYKKLFPGKAMPADRFADVELLVKQAADQPAAPLISIVVPLYNTPTIFWWSCWTRYRTRPTATGSCAWWMPDRTRTWEPSCRSVPAPTAVSATGNWTATRALRATPIRVLPLPPVTISPCWTMMTFCTPVHCGMWRKPSPSRVRTLCTPTK